MTKKTSHVLFYVALILTPVIALFPQNLLVKMSLMSSSVADRRIIPLLILINLLVGAGCALVGVNYRRYVNTPVRVITALWAVLSLLTFAVVLLPVSRLGVVLSQFYTDRTYLIFGVYLVLLFVSFVPNNRQAGEQAAD